MLMLMYPEFTLLKCLFKQKKINASKTYSPRGMHAALAKKSQQFID